MVKRFVLRKDIFATEKMIAKKERMKQFQSVVSCLNCCFLPSYHIKISQSASFFVIQHHFEKQKKFEVFAL